MIRPPEGRRWAGREEKRKRKMRYSEI